jgi:hypothetical protein
MEEDCFEVLYRAAERWALSVVRVVVCRELPQLLAEALEAESTPDRYFGRALER